MATGFKILNQGELKGSPSYCSVFNNRKTILLHRGPKIIRTEEIDWVKIVQNRSIKTNSVSQMQRDMMTGGIVAGLLGALLGAAFQSDPVQWDVDCDIHLKTGEVVEVHINHRDKMKHLFPHATATNPRAVIKSKRNIQQLKQNQRDLNQQLKEINQRIAAHKKQQQQEDQEQKQQEKQLMEQHEKTWITMRQWGWDKDEFKKNMDKLDLWHLPPDQAVRALFLQNN